MSQIGIRKKIHGMVSDHLSYYNISYFLCLNDKKQLLTVTTLLTSLISIFFLRLELQNRTLSIDRNHSQIIQNINAMN